MIAVIVTIVGIATALVGDVYLLARVRRLEAKVARHASHLDNLDNPARY